MALQFTSVPPIPRGMNLAGPPVFLDDAYCRWMQDVLVDRPGQIRMRGPMDYVTSSGLSSNDQILGAAETYISTNDGAPQWRGAVFVANDTVASTTLTEPTSNGFMRVYKNVDGVVSAVNNVPLPFKLITKYDQTLKRWVNNTIIDAKPALGGGVWVGVIDDITNTTNSGTSALFYWRGAGLPEASFSSCSWDTRESPASTTSNRITVGASPVGNVEAGMFAFDTTNDDNGNGRYLGIVASVTASGGNYVYLEKDILDTVYNQTVSGRTVVFRSIRGFVHQYGRGFANYDGAGEYLTSGGIGTDAEGLFKAARLTLGGGSASNHRAYVYRNSDHRFVGEIKYGGIVSNTQVQLDSTNKSGQDASLLQGESYFIIRDDTTIYKETALADDTKKYPMLLNKRRPNQKPGALTLTNNTEYAQPAPGIFNSTYAGRQWFASFNTSDNTYDEYINRVVFSSTDNPENINLCQDASDSIIIPGREAIRGIAGSVSGLLVFVDSKTYIIRGTNRQNFALEELYPDGCLSTNSIVQVGGGVIWAGKQGIYYFDGATVRNFTPDPLGVYYTDGIKNYKPSRDRIYAFVYNNYLVINFTSWYSNYSMLRYAVDDSSYPDANSPYVSLTDEHNTSKVTPDRITFCIYLPSGAIGTLSNFTPRGAMVDAAIMCANNSTNVITPPTGNSGVLLNLKAVFTENTDDYSRDGDATLYISNDSVYSTPIATSGPYTSARRSTGPDFYFETKQYNFDETTLRKWFRKLMFNLRVNQGYMMIEFIDINDKSLVSPATGGSVVTNSDESGYYLIPSTGYTWNTYQNSFDGTNIISPEFYYLWSDLQAIGLPSGSWLRFFSGVEVRYSRWLGIRRSSLGFRMYSLRNYDPNNTGSEVMPEIVNVNDWIWGLKPLRSGRN